MCFFEPYNDKRCSAVTAFCRAQLNYLFIETFGLSQRKDFAYYQKVAASMNDVEVKLILNGPDGEGTYSALCESLVAIPDQLKRKALCMAYLAFVFGNDYCAGMNQVCRTETYAGNNLSSEQQVAL